MSEHDEDEEMLEEEAEEYAEEEEVAEDNALQEEEAVAETAAEAQEAGQTTGGEINTSTFTELRLEPDVIQGAKDAWNTFVRSQASSQVAAEAIYTALFESAPSLQSLFVTPRAVQAMKFYAGLAGLVGALDDPAALKEAVEAQGFGHLATDVTVPRVVVFRDAILDLFQVELGDRWTSRANAGWKAVLNYFGGAMIWTKTNFAERLGLLASSWKLATAGEDKDKTAGQGDGSAADEKKKKDAGKKGKKGKKGKEGEGEQGEGEQGKGKGNNQGAQNIPTTFAEMFQFNAAVMGYSASIPWMNEVLACFENIVTNVSNSNRFREECDFLMLRITKATTLKVNLGEFKSCMLASLRSCLPKVWTMPHEVAWSWMWENVEKLILKTFGMPPKWEKALVKYVGSLDEETAFKIRKNIYETFFVLCPPGQYLFKQSDAYLHIIAQKVIVMTMDIYRVPIQMVDDISALGLRHVGYAIPTDYFAPFSSACMEVLQQGCSDEAVLDSFRWSIALVAKSLVRTILEGSTVIMKAINNNTEASITKGLASAPRSERGQWMLLVQVGTQNISPLLWALEAGSLNSASAIIKDLLVIRADRDNYYYGMAELFTRHTDIVKRLGDDAPQLLPTLFDGMFWRSHLSVNGTRRVNYYIKFLLVTLDGKFAKTLEWIGEKANPKIVIHPVLSICADLVWGRLAYRKFLMKKSWILATLLLFLCSQSIMYQHNRGHKDDTEKMILFALRALLYGVAMMTLIVQHTMKIVKAYQRKATYKLFGRIPIPEYLLGAMELVSFSLTVSLLIMVCTEPVFHCVIGGDDLGTTECDSSVTFFPYSFFAMVAMCLYFISLTDMVVFITTVCAFFIALGRLTGEVALFLGGLFFAILSFGCAINCLHQSLDDFHGPPAAVLTYLKVFLRMYNSQEFEDLHKEEFVLVGAFVFMGVAFIFLFNLLIAQLCCAYDTIYRDMLGFARLNRIDILVDTVPQISELRWQRFVEAMAFDSKLEFNAGDIGLPGGVQVLEPANANPTNKCSVVRYGGSTSLSIPWPVSDDEDADTDKFDKLEKMIQKAMQQASTKKAAAGMNSSMGAGSSGVQTGGSGDSAGSAATE